MKINYFFKIMKVLYIFIIFFVLSVYTNVQGGELNKKTVVKIFVYNGIELIEEGYYPIAIPKVGHGSGLLLSSDGIILTAKHVIRDEETGDKRVIAVSIPGSPLIYPAEVIYKDDNSDFAFLYIEGKFDDYKALPKKPPKIKSEKDIKVYGYPKDAWASEASTTKGIISRYVDETGWWQTDAPVNPGNSGGPATDKKGNVIGIVVAKHRSGEGMGYILPLDNVIKVYSELKKSKKIDDVKNKVANMSPEEKETKRTLSDFIARVVTFENKLAFINEFMKPDIIRSFSNVKSSENVADWLVLSSSVIFDSIILTLSQNGISLQDIANLNEKTMTQIQENLNTSFFIMALAIKIDPSVRTESIERMMNTMNLLINYIAISKNKGKVISAEDDIVLIGLGSKDGVKVGSYMDIYSRKNNEKIATVKVTEVNESFSISILTNKPIREISEGDDIKEACKEGRVNRIDGDIVYIDLGSSSGVIVGSRMEIYNSMKEKIGIIEITKTYDPFSKATIVESYKEIMEGNIVKFCTH